MARYPLNGNPRISSYHGQPTGMGHFGRHLGIDRVVVNQPFYAPTKGRIISVRQSASLGHYIEAEFFGLHWRFAHLSRVSVKAGQNVAEGTQLGVTGNTGITTGPHLHYDARVLGTAWNSSFSNYRDPDAIIAQAIANERPRPVMPAVGSLIQLIPKDKRTTFRAGTTTRAGTIDVKDNTYVYTVRGYDSRYPGRIIINSASAGGNGVALALYYTNGVRIPGWKQL